jgi:hypothetical protein
MSARTSRILNKPLYLVRNKVIVDSGFDALAPLKTSRGEHMNGPIILNEAREQLANEIFPYREPKPASLKISPWLAMSLLQKAIRRGESQLAQHAAR